MYKRNYLTIKSTHLKVWCLLKLTVFTAVVAIIRWINLFPTFGSAGSLNVGIRSHHLLVASEVQKVGSNSTKFLTL